jgi:environmental stress-induced protein Ves
VIDISEMRRFAVITGNSVTLHFPDSTVVQRLDDPLLHFDGANTPGCTLLSGATVDLNLMVRNAAHGTGVMLRAAAGKSWISNGTPRAFYTADAASLVTTDHAATTLPPNTLAWSRDSASRAWWMASGR